MESKKSKLQVKVEETKKNLQLYDSLRDDVGKFSLALHTAVILLKSDHNSMDEKGRTAKLKSMVNELADSMSAIQSTLAKINDDETKATVEKVVKQLGPELAKVSNSPRITSYHVKDLLSECENIFNHGVKHIINQIEKKKLELYAEIGWTSTTISVTRGI